jgi:cytoskeletal protein RodZ
MIKVKKIFLIGFILLITLGAVLVVLQNTHAINFFGSVQNKQKQQDSQYNTEKKKAAIERTNKTPGADGSNSSTTGTYTPPVSSDGISLSASQPNANQIVVTSKLVGYSDGTCTLTVTNGAKSTTQRVQVIYQPQFSTCAGFTIPISTIGSGNWVLSLVVNSGGLNTSKTINLVVQ